MYVQPTLNQTNLQKEVIMSKSYGPVGLYLDVKDIDAIYAAGKNPRILQRISKGMGSLKDLLFTTIDKGNPLIDNKASCECGATTVDHGNDEVCDICLSTVMPITERSVTPSLYMTTPYKINHFVYPYIYQSLRHAFDIGVTKHPYNPFVALLGGRTPTNPMHKVIKNRMPNDLLGYNNAVADLPRFINSLVDIIFDLIAPKERGVISKEITSSHRDRKRLTSALYEARELAQAISKYDLPYKSKVLPVRSKLLMTLEEGTYSTTSQTTDQYARAIVCLNDQPIEASDLDPRARKNYRPEARIIRFYELHSEFRSQWYKDEGSKGGAMRTDSITARSGLVLRSVQAQNCDPHHSEDIGLPYSQSIIVFQAHLVHWFKKKKRWSSNKCIQFLEDNLRVHNHELWEAMNTIVREISAEGGLSYAIRYPSIYRTSGLTSKMSFVKKDPNDRTLSVSSSSLPANSGDLYLMGIDNLLAA